MSSISQLLKRLNAESDQVLLVRSHDSIGPKKNKEYLDDLLQVTDLDGTLCLLADCDFNTNAATNSVVSKISNQERFVLSSNKMMQLLTLRRDCYYADHPALMFASVGKYSKYFSRQKPLDFPFGRDSIFEDLHDMDAILLFITAKHVPYEGKYALTDWDNQLIKKNTSISNEEIVSYLDFSCDYQKIHSTIFGNGLMLYEIDKDTVIYGVRYRDYIEEIQKNLPNN